MDGFHREGVPQDNGNPFFSAQIGAPGPGEETLDRHHQAVPLGGNALEEGFRRGFHMTVHEDFAVVAQDTDVHGAGVHIDTAVKLVLIGVESH
jgi:hypothetical protein